jgi:hypothetical protein
MHSVLIFFKSIKFGHSFLLHLVYFINDLKRLNKKTFLKNPFLLNKDFQDLTLDNDFKKSQ